MLTALSNRSPEDPIRTINNASNVSNKVCVLGVSLKNTLIRNNRAPGVSDTLKPRWRGILMQMHLSMWGGEGAGVAACVLSQTTPLTSV